MYFVLFIIFIVISSLQYSNGANTQKFADLPIVYPGPIQEKTEEKYGVDIFSRTDDVPDECKDQTFCTIKPKGYPQEKFNDLFNGMAFVPQPQPELDDGIDNKQGDPDEKDGCESIVTYEPVYKVKSSMGDWRTVIQSPEHNFVQKLRLETCLNTGSSCFSVFRSPPGFVTSCKQKFSTWELLVDGDKGPDRIKTDLPVCCSCVYRTASHG